MVSVIHLYRLPVEIWVDLLDTINFVPLEFWVSSLYRLMFSSCQKFRTQKLSVNFDPLGTSSLAVFNLILCLFQSWNGLRHDSQNDNVLGVALVHAFEHTQRFQKCLGAGFWDWIPLCVLVSSTERLFHSVLRNSSSKTTFSLCRRRLRTL